MPCVAFLLAVLTVVETSGRFQVLKEGRPVISSVVVDRGVKADESSVRSSFAETEKGRVWNRWSEERDGRFRLEVAERKDGAVEITLSGESDPSDVITRRKLHLRVPVEVLDDAAYSSWGGKPGDPVFESGTLAAGMKPVDSRFFAANGLVFDFNPIGVADSYAASRNFDGWRFADTICGVATVARVEDCYAISSGKDIEINWGGFTGAKIVLREGGFDDFSTYHALSRFGYMIDSSPVHLVGFGTSRRGNVYADGDCLYDARRGYGWLDSHMWKRTPLVGSETSGVLYSGLTGEEDETYRFSNLPDGFYLVTFAAGNPGNDENRFTVRANGETFFADFTLKPRGFRRMTRVVRAENGKIDVGLSGRWVVSAVGLQVLALDGEDFQFRRGFWVSEGYEPMTLFRGSLRPTPQFSVQDEIGELPMRGEEVRGVAKDYPLPVSLPDQTALAGTAWTKTAKIVRVLNNSSAMANFDKAGELERYFDRFVDGKGYNAIMLSGMLSRHTYPEDVERGLAAVGRITAEAHRRGYKVIDHFDMTLLWNIGAGFRVLGERLDEMNRSVRTGLPAYQLCMMNPDLRRKFFDYCRRDVVENGVDGLQLDEVQPWGHGCQCCHCRAAFRCDTGWHFPMDETSDAWNADSEFMRVWKRWRTKKVTDTIGELRNFLRKDRPDLVFSAYTTPYGIQSAFDALTNGRDIFDMPRSVNFFGVEVMSRAVMKSFRGEFSCRRIMSMLSRRNGAPVWNWYYNSDWQNDYTAWAIDEMTAQIPMLCEVEHPVGTPDYAVFSRGMKREGAVSPAKIAVLFSVENRNWNKTAKTGTDVNGIIQALDRLHVPCDVVSDEELEAGLADRYAILVHPSKTVFTALQTASLDEFKRRGGKVVECAGGIYAMPEFTVGYPRSKYYATPAAAEAEFLREVATWASDGRVWEVSAPDQVCTSLFREADGAWAAHFLNMTGVDFTPDEIVTADAPVRGFPALSSDVVFTVPTGSKAVATSPDFEGERELAVRVEADGRATVTLPKECLKVYAFVRIQKEDGK